MKSSYLEMVAAVSPSALERARRLEYAVHLIRTGTPKSEASALVRERYDCCRMTAWRTVDMAWDLAGDSGMAEGAA